MDWKVGDILFHYQGNYDKNGNFVLMSKILAKCTAIDKNGEPEVTIVSGEQYLKRGLRFVRIGNVTDTSRQSGIFFDNITNYKPRMVVYDGFDSFTKYNDNYIVDNSLIIAQIGNLDSVYNENLGGYLTGKKGIYSKSLYLDISGDSKLYIKENDNNYFLFDGGLMSIVAERFILRSTNLGIYSGPSAMILLGTSTGNYNDAKIGFKNDGSGKLANGNIYWDAAGNAYFNGNITTTSSSSQIIGATIKTATSGNRVEITSQGLFGYHSTLGTVFSIPTNGEAPTFASGIIKEVTYEMYTNGVIKTSANVGSGDAGILINNTGIYALAAGQNTSNANVKILTNGSLQVISGTIANWSISSSSINSTNIGLIGGTNAMILIGHESVYDSAKIGFKNDGSGKLANGNISWDAAGNITQHGNWTSDATITGLTIIAGTFKTATSGNRVEITSQGLFGYHTTLGTVFSIPTNGEAPTFASGIIKEVTYEMYTSGVIKTSANVGSGDAGILINNTGIYALATGQNTSNANVRILADGSAYFKGSIESGSTITGVTITGSTFKTSTGNPRVEINSGGLYIYNNTGEEVAYFTFPDAYIKNGNFEGGTITGATIQTATTNPRVVINNTGLTSYDYDETYLKIQNKIIEFFGSDYYAYYTGSLIYTDDVLTLSADGIYMNNIPYITSETSYLATENWVQNNYKWGSITGSLYVASTSGGSPTTTVVKRQLTIGSTTYEILTLP